MEILHERDEIGKFFQKEYFLLCTFSSCFLHIWSNTKTFHL